MIARLFLASCIGLSACVSAAQLDFHSTNDFFIPDINGIKIYVEMEKCKALDKKSEIRKCIQFLESRIIYTPFE